MSESDLTRRMCRTLSAAGAKCIALVASMMQEAGLPDRLIVHVKWFGFIEAKAEKGALTALQQIKLKDLSVRGAPCVVAWYGEHGSQCVLYCVNNERTVAVPMEIVVSGKQADGHKLLYTLAEITKAWTPETWFEARNRQHRERVTKYGAKLLKWFPDLGPRLVNHDKSKDRSVLFMWLTWLAKGGDIPEGMDGFIHEAMIAHVTGEEHHPEFWDLSKQRRYCINRDDRDAPPPGGPICATAMSDIAIAEMVADWMAVAEERGQLSARQYADAKIGTRWTFTPAQVELIYKLIGECER